MNIFVLDSDPKKAAQLQCNKHIVKMPLETAQMLCIPFWLRGISPQYKLTHKNHKCSIWARKSESNFNWLIIHGLELCAEYTRRYNKIHKSQAVIEWCNQHKSLLSFDEYRLTPFVEAIPADAECRKIPSFQIYTLIERYHSFYIHDKTFAKWPENKTPE